MRVDVPRMLALLGVAAEHCGDEWRARCPSPDHEDRNPSWRVLEDGRHYCRSCHWGGGPVDLVQAAYRFRSRAYAAYWLNVRGLVDSESDVESDVEPDDLEGDEEPPGPFAMPAGVVGLNALSSWPTPYRRFATRRGLRADQVVRWHLAVGVDGRLAGRLVMPAYAEGGRLARYTARAVFGQEPRYLTPHRAENPDWTVVHGEHLWPDGPRDVVYVAEGALNAMALERAGARWVASLDGSSLREDHVERLATFRRLVVVSDPDRAGDSLAAQLAAQARWVSFKRLVLPGVDANDLERRDPGALAHLLRVV